MITPRFFLVKIIIPVIAIIGIPAFIFVEFHSIGENGKDKKQSVAAAHFVNGNRLTADIYLLFIKKLALFEISCQTLSVCYGAFTAKGGNGKIGVVIFNDIVQRRSEILITKYF